MIEVKAHNLVNLEGPDLENAIKNDFGISITGAEKVAKGYNSQVYSAKIGEQVVFIRINKDRRVFDAEVLGYQTFKKQGISVPEIIAYKTNPSSIGQPTMIMSSAEGRAMNESDSSTEQKDILYERLGGLLGKINETKLEGFGKLIVKDGNLCGEFKDWNSYWESNRNHYIKGIAFMLENGFITEQEAQKTKEVFEEVSFLKIQESSLLHRDIHPGHFFVNGTDITGIIDLGELMAGDPRLDIAVGLFFQNEREQAFFKKGYGKLSDDPLVNKYLLIILIDKVVFEFKVRQKYNPKLLDRFYQTLKLI